jgi:cobalt-zinc-cadmium efflux system membrane fusion protein
MMKMRWKQMGRRNEVVFVALILMTVATIFAGCNKIDRPVASRDAPAAHAEHGGEDHGQDVAMSLEEIMVAMCEHDIFAYECSECRYEVGVVKVDASLLCDPHGSANGLMRTTQVRTGKIGHVIDVTGEVRLNENVAAHISPRIAGVIRSVNIDIGQQVKQGDVLLEIDSVELGQALSEYARNKTLAELSRKNFEREKGLHARRIGSEREMIDAQMTFEQHQTDLKTSEHKLYVLGRTQKDIAAVELNNHATVASTLPVRAPIDGIVIQKHAVVGELVQPGNDIILIADLDSVWVWADIYAQDLAPLIETTDKGETLVSVSVPAFPTKTFRGVIDYVGATMDEQTRTVKVRATVENEDRLLRPGMFCEATIALDTGNEACVVPANAVLTDEAADFVFTHMKDDYYVRRPVTRGRESLETVEIIDGLKPGETVVADGAFLLKSDVLREKLGAGCAD